MPILNLIDQIFDRLEVKEFVGTKNGTALWLCVCKCGEEKIISREALRSKNTKSCGCLSREIRKELGKNNIKHGMAKRGAMSSEYNIRRSMISRCYNPRNKAYGNYGGRGITVCQEWLDSPRTFFIDMGPKPKGLTLERKDNNLGYSKNNCIWATPLEQANNTRRNKFYTYNNKTQTLTLWAREYNKKYTTLRHRLDRDWTIERALIT